MGSGRSLEGTGGHPESPTQALAVAARRRREQLGLRQEEVADLADCSERFVHSLENAKPTLRVDKVLDVLAVLGLSLLVVPGQGDLRDGSAAPPAQETT